MQEVHSPDPAPGGQGESPPTPQRVFPGPPGLGPPCRPNWAQLRGQRERPRRHRLLPTWPPGSSLPSFPEPKCDPNHRQGWGAEVGRNQKLPPRVPMQLMLRSSDRREVGRQSLEGQSQDSCGTSGTRTPTRGQRGPNSCLRYLLGLPRGPGFRCQSLLPGLRCGEDPYSLQPPHPSQGPSHQRAVGVGGAVD